MRKQFTIFGFSLLIFAAVTITALAQKGKEDKGKGDQKEQRGNPGKGDQDKDKGRDKGDKDQDNRGKGKNDDGNKGKYDDKDKDKGGDKHDNDDKGENGKGNGKVKGEDFRWTTETFRDRDNIRKNQEKVTLCHKPNRDGKPGVTITVSSSALNAHLNHGDVRGECPKVDNTRYSNDYLRKRTDYYNVLQNSQEQVIYSKSILDYALERLTGARTQLVTLQNNNVPAAEIERKQVVVVELENNVSLLRTLVGVTANIVATKLMD